VILPKGDNAPKQVRPAKERAVGRRFGAKHDVIAPTRAAMAAIDHEFLGGKPRQPRLFVEGLGYGNGLVPTQCRLNIHLDDAWVRRDLDHAETPIVGGLIALYMNRPAGNLGRLLYRS